MKILDWFKGLFAPNVSPEIILTKLEAKKQGLDLKKNPKGYYTKIDGIRVPINILKEK